MTTRLWAAFDLAPGWMPRSVLCALSSLYMWSLVVGQVPADFVWMSPVGVLFAAQSSTFLFLLNALWTRAWFFLSAARFPNASFYFAQALAVFAVVSDMNYFSLYRAHFDWAGTLLMIDALLGGELGQTEFLRLGHAAWGVFGILVLAGLHVFMQRRFKAPTAVWVRTLKLVPVVLLFLTLSLDYVTHSQARSLRAAQAALPLGVIFPVTRHEYTLFSDAPEISELTELLQLERMQAEKAKFLSGISAERKPSILLMHIEGFRYDMLKPEITPNLSRWVADGSLERLPEHYSTGNQTGSSHFGLLTGLGGYAHQQAKQLDATPLPLEVLDRLGYFQSVYFVGAGRRDGIMWDHGWEAFFEKTADHRFVPPAGHTYDEEQEFTDAFLSDLDQDRAQGAPRFDYLIYYSSHYDYYYPPAFEKWKPAIALGFQIKSESAQHLRGKREALFSRYKNSLGWVDHLVNEALEGLRKRGRLDSTVVIITGDHGEEFWEKGRFGHTFGLTREQVSTSTMVSFPGGLHTRYRYTSHADFFPTIFAGMGLNRPIRSFMTGKDLRQHEVARDYAISCVGVIKKEKAYECAIVGDELKLHYENRGRLKASEVRSIDDALLLPEQVERARAASLLEKALSDKLLTPSLGASATAKAR